MNGRGLVCGLGVLGAAFVSGMGACYQVLGAAFVSGMGACYQVLGDFDDNGHVGGCDMAFGFEVLQRISGGHCEIRQRSVAKVQGEGIFRRHEPTLRKSTRNRKV